MKLAFVVPDLSRGGAQSHLIRDANGLARRGYQISVIAIGSSMEMSPELDDAIFRCTLGGRSSSPATLLRLMKKLSAIEPDVVIGWSMFANLMVALAQATGTAKKTILFENNYPPLFYPRMPPMRRLFVRAAARRIYRFGSLIAGNSDELVSYLRQWIGNDRRFARFYNPTDLQRFRMLSKESVSFPPTNKGETIILLAGRVWEFQKGIDVLLDACQRLLQFPKPWALWVIGDGGDLERLKSKANDMGLSQHVKWLGMRTNPFPFFCRSDIVVVPSRFEGFPNSLLEAMTLGRATVSADCKTGPREMTCDGKFGMLVPVDDGKSLAGALAELISSPEKRASMGEAAARHVSVTHSDERVFPELIRAIELAVA